MKTYFIAGGSSGIGKSLTETLGKDQRVYASYHQHETESASPNISYHHVDVMQESVDFSFLPDALDGLVYCPGNIILKPFHRFTAADFEQDFRLQVSGAVKVIQAALPALKKNGNASVILFSTVAVAKGFPFHSVIAASKGAVEGFCKALAAELAPQIRVNCIAPSITDTPLAYKMLDTEIKQSANAQRHPLKRIGTPKDIASMAAFLLSDEASWITGQIFHVDGGLSSLSNQ